MGEKLQAYLSLMRHILTHGEPREDRTGTGTLAIFGHQMRFDLRQGFPLLTTKKLHIPSIVHELLWFLRGDTNIAYLRQHGVRIWDEWADEDGELGPVYGRQWRAWPTPDGGAIDQIAEVLRQLRETPHSRRILVCAWNVSSLEEMALPPCHVLFQFFVSRQGLSLQLYQRSCDVFLGLPFNIASYALLLHMVAQQCDLPAHEFIWTGGDVHLYRNHLSQARLQLQREPLPLPRLQLDRAPDLFSYTIEQIHVLDYQAHPHIKGTVSV